MKSEFTYHCMLDALASIYYFDISYLMNKIHSEGCIVPSTQVIIIYSLCSHEIKTILILN